MDDNDTSREELKDSDVSLTSTLVSYDGEARFKSEMMGYGGGSSSRSSRSSEDDEGEKSLLHRYRDQGSDSFSIDVGSSASPFRPATATASGLKARARLQLRRLTRLMPRPIITVVILALVSLLGVTLTLNDQVSTSSLRELQAQWRKVLPESVYAAEISSESTSVVPTYAFSSAADSHKSGLPRRPVPIQSHLEFLKDDGKYLEAWVARGEILEGLSFAEHTKIDGLWNWVNGR